MRSNDDATTRTRRPRNARRPRGASVLDILRLEDRTLLSTFTPRLIADINRGPGDSLPNNLQVAEVGGAFLFGADDGEGRGLWRSDGTEAGTALVADINPLTGLGLAVVGDTAFFAADDGVRGFELWKSDGTPEGTQLVKDIRPGSGFSFFISSFPSSFTVVDDTLYFTANDGTHGVELWKTDGTEAGTALVADINPGPASAFSFFSTGRLFDLGGELLALANDGTHGEEPWISDGSEAGTELVIDLNPGPVGSPALGFTGARAVVSGGELYFPADDGALGAELWKTDGTADGTVLVADVNPGPAGSDPRWLVEMGGALFFEADDGTVGRALWRSDGELGDSRLIADPNPALDGPTPGAEGLTVAGGTLFFGSYTPELGTDLYATDGTPEGTRLVKDFGAGSDDPNSGIVLSIRLGSNLIDLDGTLFFGADDGIHGYELWSSDGTTEGTNLVADLNPGAEWGLSTSGGTSRALANAGGTLWFVGNDGTSGFEPWKLLQDVALDIKPGSDDNPINLKSNGITPVAVLTSDDFDAASVDTTDLSTIRFGDVRLAVRVSPVRSVLEDVDGDGDLDLLLSFSTREIRDSGALVPDSEEAELTAVSDSGQELLGSDTVRIVPPSGGPGGMVHGGRSLIHRGGRDAGLLALALATLPGIEPAPDLLQDLATVPSARRRVEYGA